MTLTFFIVFLLSPVASPELKALFLLASDLETHLERFDVRLDQLRLLLELVLDSLDDDIFRNGICSADIYTKHDDIESSLVLDVDSHLSNRSFDDLDVISVYRICNDRAVHKESPARFEVREEFVKRRTVHYYEILV